MLNSNLPQNRCYLKPSKAVSFELRCPISFLIIFTPRMGIRPGPNLLKSMAKLANIVREHVKYDMIANNVAQFGHHVGQQIQAKKCSWHVCTCSKHFREHLLFDGMLPNLATMFANNSTQSSKDCARIMRKSFKSIVTSTSLVAKWILD